ncbi:hypothetical protein I4F81_007790 [Pyropia yezoensis]|uniref:Uncharacterized protein n=1 Tax=Pyropia yezoensis TaxID=2788 RepID=A0ACC3C5K9_PYRYE|nr:hypothetical protein I4F81_007790 [Neopyropia yezoensis]
MARVIRRWRAAVALAVATAAAVVGSPPGGGGVAAHSSCRSPLESTWSNSCRIGGINGAWKNCPGPCPRDPDRKNYRVEQFRRGQWIPFVYYKNNHSGGFLRLSLVPLHHRFNAWAHKRNAFRWSCWDHGMVNCPQRNSHECGTDRNGKRYQQWVEIPKVFPDGEYYLSYLWYGGTFRQGDYYSCAKIRISGGPIQNTWKPIYVNNKNGQCYSTASTLGQCRQEPCYRPPHWIRPDAWNGRTPGQLNRWEVTK